MNRRDLLAAVATLAGAKALSAATGKILDTQIPLSRRVIPARPISLQSSDLEILFDAKDGVPYEYRFKGKNQSGESFAKPVSAIICLLKPRKYFDVEVTVASETHKRGEIRFLYSILHDGHAAVDFTIRYAVDRATLVVTLESVVEHPGFELIEVALPALATVFEEGRSSWMAEGRNGGSFVYLDQAKAHRLKDNEYFGRISTELPIGMVGADGIGCLMEVSGYMDGTETEISGESGQRRAAIGTIQAFRVHGGRCYSMNDGGPPICGNAQTLNLSVGQTPRTRFDFFEYGDDRSPWLVGAKIMRDRMQVIPTSYFDDKFLYIVGGKLKVEAEPRTTLAQSRQLVQDIAALTDRAPQITLLGGWAYDGQDTGFPSEDKVNASLGTNEEMCGLIADGKQWNANITLNVNYDDAYKSSPIFDPAFIARRPDGEIWASRAWDGETSYVVGMAKFMKGGWGSRRIHYTVEHYKIHDAMLVDALSWFTIRNDWDPLHPASGYKNLVDGKIPLLKEACKLGVHITSETLRYPLIGTMALTMNGPGPSNCPFGGEPVPLLSVIYRRSAIWGNSGDGSVKPQRDLFWNSRPAIWFQNNSDRAFITDLYFLVVLPYNKLNPLEVETYTTTGTIREIGLSRRSKITRDTANTSYSAILDGVEIARDDATFCPIDKDRIAFYAISARTLHCPIPKDWDRDKIVARQLTVKGKLPFAASFENNDLVIKVPQRQPVIVYRCEECIDPQSAAR